MVAILILALVCALEWMNYLLKQVFRALAKVASNCCGTSFVQSYVKKGTLVEYNSLAHVMIKLLVDRA